MKMRQYWRGGGNGSFDSGAMGNLNADDLAGNVTG